MKWYTVIAKNRKEAKDVYKATYKTHLQSRLIIDLYFISSTRSWYSGKGYKLWAFKVHPNGQTVEILQLTE